MLVDGKAFFRGCITIWIYNSLFVDILFLSEYLAILFLKMNINFCSFSSAIFWCKIYCLFCKLPLVSEPLHAANKQAKWNGHWGSNIAWGSSAVGEHFVCESLCENEGELSCWSPLSIMLIWAPLCFLSQGAKIKILKNHGWLLPLPWIYCFPYLSGMWCLLCVYIVVCEFWLQAIEPGRKNNYRWTLTHHSYALISQFWPSPNSGLLLFPNVFYKLQVTVLITPEIQFWFFWDSIYYIKMKNESIEFSLQFWSNA